MHYGVLGMKWGVRRSVKKANKYPDKSTKADSAHELGRKIKFQKAKRAYDQNNKLTKKYVKDIYGDTGVDRNKAKKYRKKLDSSNERLTKRTEEYLNSLGKVKVKSLLKKDIEHGYRYVDARIFDPNLTYDRDIRISDGFANRYK